MSATPTGAGAAPSDSFTNVVNGVGVLHWASMAAFSRTAMANRLGSGATAALSSTGAPLTMYGGATASTGADRVGAGLGILGLAGDFATMAAPASRAALLAARVTPATGAVAAAVTLDTMARQYPAYEAVRERVAQAGADGLAATVQSMHDHHAVTGELGLRAASAAGRAGRRLAENVGRGLTETPPGGDFGA